MQKEFYQTQIERIGRAWAAPTEEFQKMLWSAVKHGENHEFEAAVGHLIGEHTGRQLPAVSRFREALSLFRAGGARGPAPEIRYNCPACQDWGYGWVEHTIVACSCSKGRHTSPAELAEAQKAYDKGRRLFKSPFDKDPLPPSGERIFPALPYDPKERQGA